MKKKYIGELEEVILLITVYLDDQAYGVAITRELNSKLNRKISVSAVHATLHRLLKKGYVTSSLGGASEERGGRRKRIFKITPTGVKIIHEVQEVRNLLWSEISSKPSLI